MPISGVHVKLVNRRHVTDVVRAEFGIGSSRSRPKMSSWVLGDDRSAATRLTLSVDVGSDGSKFSANTIGPSSSACVTPSPFASVARK